MSNQNFAAVDMDNGSDDNTQRTSSSSGNNSLTIEQMTELYNQTASRLNSVEEQLAITKSENVALKKENNMLKQTLANVTWSYKASVPPSSYWYELEYDDEYIDNLCNYFFASIKRDTHKIRRGQFVENKIDIDIGNGDVGEFDAEEVTIIHDDTLISHWRELADALKQQNLCTGVQLNIINMHLPYEVLAILMQGLAEKDMHRMSLDGVVFQEFRQGIDFAVDMIQRSRMMQHFCWAYNGMSMTDITDSNRLFEAVVNHPSLTTITLDAYIGHANGYDNLISLLTTQSTMKELVYRGNNVLTGGDTRLSEFIATNPPLRELVLCRNELKDEDAIRIAYALQHNTNLLEFNLTYNRFTELGTAALERAVCDQSSLNSLSDCNHSCAVSTKEGTLFNECSNRASSNQGMNRGNKLYKLMSARNKEGTNVDCLKREMDDDDIFKLMPNILECIQSYHSCYERTLTHIPWRSEVYPLSIMFELSRTMPDIFER